MVSMVMDSNERRDGEARPPKETRRERLHEATRAEIKATARAQMAAEGGAALSLRAVARAMGLTAPALYRYYASRDELLTALILDAFTAFAAALEGADAVAAARHGAAAFPDRLAAVLIAYRRWALDHATEFALIYGTPIPGYAAPADLTAPAAARGAAALIRVVAEADGAGRLSPPPADRHMPPPVERAISHLIARQGYPIAPPILYRGLSLWSAAHGLVMLELFGHLEPIVGDGDAYYRARVREMLAGIGLAPAEP